MSFVTSLIGGILGSNAANKAASTEQQGAQQAQQLEQQKADAALQAQQTALGNVTAAEQPYQTLGSTSANALASRLATGFTAPTLAEAQQTPGYQFTLGEGINALDKSAAATGNLFSGTHARDLAGFAENLANTTYQQDYQNALNTYMANINPLLSATGLGLSSTGQLTGANLDIAGNNANINMRTGEDQARQINNAAAARASGYLGSANAWSNAVGGMFGGASNVISNMPKAPDWLNAVAMA